MDARLLQQRGQPAKATSQGSPSGTPRSGVLPPTIDEGSEREPLSFASSGRSEGWRGCVPHVPSGACFFPPGPAACSDSPSLEMQLPFGDLFGEDAASHSAATRHSVHVLREVKHIDAAGGHDEQSRPSDVQSGSLPSGVLEQHAPETECRDRVAQPAETRLLNFETAIRERVSNTKSRKMAEMGERREMIERTGAR